MCLLCNVQAGMTFAESHQIIERESGGMTCSEAARFTPLRTCNMCHNQQAAKSICWLQS